MSCLHIVKAYFGRSQIPIAPGDKQIVRTYSISEQPKLERPAQTDMVVIEDSR